MFACLELPGSSMGPGRSMKVETIHLFSFFYERFFTFFKDFIYLFLRGKEGERGRETSM